MPINGLNLTITKILKLSNIVAITSHLSRWYTNQRVTSYVLRVYMLTSCVYCTIYELFSFHEGRVTFCIQVTSYFLLHELWVAFYIRVTSYCLFHELPDTFIARVTSYCLLHKLPVTVYCTIYEWRLAYELKLLFICDLLVTF